MVIEYVADNGDFIGMVEDDCCPAIWHQVFLPYKMLETANFHKDTVLWVKEVKHYYLDVGNEANKSMTSITLSVAKPVLS